MTPIILLEAIFAFSAGDCVVVSSIPKNFEGASSMFKTVCP